MRTRSLLTVGALVATSLVPLTATSVAVAGAAVVGDGTTASTAAPSCWSIKQANPAAADGTYWLQTPKLVTPQQFFCDMTTDGGGWVLIGRGRDGWNFNAHGQGSPTTVRTTRTGTGAFAPAALPSDTVDGLLDGGRVDQLPDGIRVRRAADATGSSWQEVRWHLLDPTTWSWALGGGERLSSIQFDGTSYPISNPVWTSGSTRETSIGSNSRLRISTSPDTAHNSRAGFAYGTSITGVNNSTSYLWQYTNEGKALPFSQLWLRPRLTAADLTYPPVADAGAPATTLAPLVDDHPQHMPFGVTGVLKVDDPVPTLDASVLAFTQIGNTMYVGGKFQYVRSFAGVSTEQHFLAAFDVDTGEWRSAFLPALDGEVMDLAATPDGKLIVAGNFRSINGAPNTSGLAALDPTTGAVLTNWTGAVTTPYSTSVRPYVRSIDLKGNWLYISGSFKKVLGGSPIGAPVTVARVARLRVSDGKPDGTWKPTVNGGIVHISVSPTGDRLYMSGSFTQVNTTTVNQIAAIDTTTAAAIAIPWVDDDTGTEPQNTINEYGNRLYIGGSQHYLHMYDRDSFALLRAHMTRNGGDFQAMAVVGNVLYGSCHCTNWDFQDTHTWANPSGYTRIDPINYIGAYDLTTLTRIGTFEPTLHSANGEGPWRLTPDDRGCLWSGGDHDRGRYDSSGAQEWVGGFVRFCPRDTTAPTTPTSFAATPNGTATTLSWKASTDNVGVSTYEVLRDDRVIGTTTGTTLTDTPTGNARYFVRAVDATGNRSATTAVLRVGATPPTVATFVTAGSSWRYRADGTDLGTAWRTPGFDTSTWATGAAQLGWGDGDEATVIPSTAITQYFVRTFDVADPSAIKTLVLRLLRDDGAAVWINGVEVTRSNLPAGPLTASTLASTFATGSQETTWYQSSLAASALVAGTNTIAVEVHQGSAANADASFDLSLTGRGSVESTVPTAPTTPAVTGRTDTTVSLAWGAATDDTAVIGYRIRRDGTDIAFTDGTAYVDSGLAAATTHSYDVIAVDSSGNSSDPASVTATTTPEPLLVGYVASWRWRFAAGSPGPTWNAPGFDDSAWASGPGQLGFGDGDEGTVIWPGPTPTPATAYFRRTITVADPASITALGLDVIRDDGVAVYINGVEVARNNLAAGATDSTLATTAISSRTDETTPVSFAVPPGVLVAGTNTVAVEMHQSALSSADLSFALRLRATFAP